MNTSTTEAITLIRNAVAVIDAHTADPYTAAAWTTLNGCLYGTDPKTGHGNFPIAEGGDDMGAGLAPEHASMIVRTAGNPRFLRAVRIILTDAEQSLDRDASTVSANADALTLANSILEPGALPDQTSEGI